MNHIHDKGPCSTGIFLQGYAWKRIKKKIKTSQFKTKKKRNTIKKKNFTIYTTARHIVFANGLHTPNIYNFPLAHIFRSKPFYYNIYCMCIRICFAFIFTRKNILLHNKNYKVKFFFINFSIFKLSKKNWLFIKCYYEIKLSQNQFFNISP